MAAEREIVRGVVDSNRMGHGVARHHQMRSSEGVMSPNEFNIDYNNDD